MQVMHCSHVQQAHETLAALTAEEVQLFKEKNPLSLAKAVCFATTTRFYAASACALWACGEIVRAFPRMVAIGCSKPVSWKTMDIYNRTIKTSIVQGVSLACAAVLPEVLYRKMQVERALFVTHLETLLETLPDFPHVISDITDHKPDNFFEPLAKMWNGLGLSNSLWRDLVQEELWKQYQKDPTKGNQILELTSLEFKKFYLAPLCRHIAQRLNENEAGIEKLDLSTFILLYNILSDQVKAKVFTQKPQFAKRLEDEGSDEGFLFQQVTGYRFRSQETVRKCNRLIEMMKRATKELVKEKIYEQDDIAMLYGESFHAVLAIGAFYFIEATSTHELHAQVARLTAEEKKALFQRLSMSESAIKNRSPLYNSERVSILFQNIVAYKTREVDHLMQSESYRPEDVPNWSVAFTS
jgi:hypothetical protein